MTLNISIALRCRDDGRKRILRKGFEHVIRRHSALRTRITLVHGAPRQLIDPPGRYNLGIRSISRQALEIEPLRTIVDEFLRTPFDLIEGKLFGSQLIRLSDSENILLINIHHILIDGFSVGIIFDELWHCYATMSRLEPVGFETLIAQYSDYAIWQEETQGAWLEEHAQYWEERLADVPPAQFPIDYCLAGGISACRKTNVALLPFRFNEALTAGIHAAARREGTMPALVVLAAFVALLWRWCDQSEFLVPIHIAGRDIPEYVDRNYGRRIIQRRNCGSDLGSLYGL